MSEFVCLPPFLKITLRVAMKSIHFQIAQTSILGHLCFACRESQKRDIVLWVQDRSIGCRGKTVSVFFLKQLLLHMLHATKI